MGEYADQQLAWLERKYGLCDLYSYKRNKRKIDLTERKSVYVSGKIYWAKIVGDRHLHNNYDGDARQWACEFAPDDEGAFLKEHKLLDRLKDKEDGKNPDKGAYIILKKPEFDKDGKKNDPFRIYDGTGDETVEWDDRLIGNGSSVDMKLQIVNWGPTKKKSIYAQAIRVTELVPFVSDEFAAMDAAKKPKAAKPKAKTVLEELDLDDDVPF